MPPTSRCRPPRRQAQIHDRRNGVAASYDTVLGSEGSDLSGGEAQRVAIARAIVQDAPILVLDEATAHADPENETAIQKALNALAKGRTTVVIAHRLDTIVHADQILVLVGARWWSAASMRNCWRPTAIMRHCGDLRQVDALEKALLVEGAAMRGAAAGRKKRMAKRSRTVPIRAKARNDDNDPNRRSGRAADRREDAGFLYVLCGLAEAAVYVALLRCCAR